MEEFKFNNLLEKLKELEIIQKRGDWAENLPDDIWENYFKGNFKEVEHNLEVDTRRWYETSITVVEIFGGYLGIEYGTNSFSENQEWEDCHIKIKFHEMKEVQTTSYESV